MLTDYLRTLINKFLKFLCLNIYTSSYKHKPAIGTQKIIHKIA